MSRRVVRWQDNAGRKRMSIFRGVHDVYRDGKRWKRQSTVVIWPEEQEDLQREFLADLGLMTIAEHERQMEEVRRGRTDT